MTELISDGIRNTQTERRQQSGGLIQLFQKIIPPEMGISFSRVGREVKCTELKLRQGLMLFMGSNPILSEMNRPAFPRHFLSSPWTNQPETHLLGI